MRTLVFIALVCCLAFALVESKKIGCHRFCFARALDKDIKSADLKDCVRKCLNETKMGSNDSSKVKKTLAKFADILSEDQTESDAEVTPGNYRTTDAVNVRRGPCTDQGIITTLSAGSVVQATGQERAACGYTWYEIKGSFGTGWAASNWLAPSTGGCKARFNAPLFKQCDPRWGNNKLGSSSTICAVGCLMSSVSMAMAGLGKTINGQGSNPGTLNQYLLTHGGYSGNLFVWGAVSPFDLTYEGQPSDKSVIKNAICQGKVVILNVNRGGHWVLATGYDGDTFTVNDPGFNRGTYAASEVGVAGIFRV
jgi:hypothetical protein